MIVLLQKLGLTPTSDAHCWMQKWSTWLSGLQFSFAAMLFTWLLFDAEMKASLPGWVPQVIAGGMLITAFVLPGAVNAVQRKLTQPPEEK
jgi:hypothetical protein